MSTSSPPGNPKDELLESWKQIAGYLQRDIRTVQRWEGAEGLPVHRHMHAERGSVYAYASELKSWSDARSHELDIHRKRPWIFASPRLAYLALALLFGLIGGIILWRNLDHRPSGRGQPVAAASRRLFARATSQGAHLVRLPLGLASNQILLTPDGAEIIALHLDDRLVSFLDTRSEKLIERVPLAGRPRAAAITPDGRRLYVGTMEGELYLIDLSNRRTIRSIRAGGTVSDMVITPDGRKAFLAMGYAGLKRLTIATGELATVPGLVCPIQLALGPAGSRLYVSYQCGGPGGRDGHDAIDILDTASETNLGTMLGPPLVGGALAASPDGTQLWADGRDACIAPGYDHVGCPQVPARVVHVFRTSDRAALESFAFTPPDVNGPIVFVPGSRVAVVGSPIDVMEAAGEVPVETLNLGHVTSLAVSPDGGRAYAVLWSEKAIARLDLAAAGCEPDPNGLAHFWPGDGNPNDVRDGMHGSIAGSVRFAPGRFGQAFSFDGRGTVSFGKRLPAGGFSSTDASLAGWIWFSGTEAQTIMERGNKRLDDGWRLQRESSGQLEFCLGTSQGLTACRSNSPVAVVSSTRLLPGAWYHWAVVKSSSSLEIYVNGYREAATALRAFADTGPGEAMHIGSNGGGPAQHWMIDEVMFYQRVLTPSEIHQLSAAPSRQGCTPTLD